MIRRHSFPALVALSLATASLGVPVASVALAGGASGASGASGGQFDKQDARSAPADRSLKIRRAKKSDLTPLGAAALAAEPGAFLSDPVVSNTVANFAATENGGDGEPSIAVNPSNPREIVIASFAQNTGFWHSLDAGATWTFQNSYTQPPGRGSIPRDQQLDFTRGNLLGATFLEGGGNIVTGTTANAALNGSWNWPLNAGNAVLTNTQGVNNSDQPWIVSAKRFNALAQDDFFVAYDDFSGAPDMQVTVANAADPPTFANDTQVGQGGNCPGGSLACATNPGLRLNADPRTGAVYAIWQTTSNAVNGDLSVDVDIHVNRTVDGGANWTLNGSTTGVVVASGASNQRDPKFGTVNALIGGVHHLAVDPVTGDAYVVYACGDETGGDNPLCLVRMHDDGSGTGTMTIDPPQTITTEHSALPSIAIATNRVIGVLYQTFDGFSGDGFPVYSAHLSVSDDQGATWSDRTLLTSVSPVTDNGNNRQRVLGDYQEIVAVGRTFYGTFTGNGVAFGRTVSNMDPIFFKTFAGGPAAAVTGDLDFGTVARGTSATRDVTVTNVGTEPLTITGVAMKAGSNAAFSVLPNPGTPVTIQPSDSITYQVKFSPPSTSDATVRTGTLVVSTNDPDTPTVELAATGTPGVPVATLAGSNLQFGDVPVDNRTAPSSSSIVLRLTNQASCALCDLRLTSLTVGGTNASDFSVVGAPALPATIGAGSQLDLTVAFDPSADGTRTATLTVGTSDPANPSQVVSLTGKGLLSGIGALPSPVIFDPTVITPACGIVCGTTKNVRITNTGQAELIVDALSFDDPAYTGPLANVPPDRIAPNGFLDEPVTFTPTAIDRSVEGVMSVQHVVDGSTITVEKNVPMCGEAVGRGIRVLVTNRAGTVAAKVDRLTLQSFATKRKISVDVRNLTPTTISPPTSCQTIRYHYENQDLPEAQTVGKNKAYYTLKVTVGKSAVTQTITLAPNEFKQLVVTVG